MRSSYAGHDVRTIRLLHDYGFTDQEMSEHLGLPPPVVRNIRGQLALPARGRAEGIAVDRRRAAERAMHHPPQAMFGGQRRHPGSVFLKLTDDRYFAGT